MTPSLTSRAPEAHPTTAHPTTAHPTTCQARARRGGRARGIRAGVALGLAAAIALTLAPTATATPLPYAASAAPVVSDTTAAKNAAAWLGWQFVDKSHLQTEYGGTAYDDAGLTLDAVLAFAASKSNAVFAKSALTWLSDPATLGGYIGDGTTESYVGAHAKLALALQVSGRSTLSYGGRDILGELATLQGSDGRFHDTSAWGDYVNTFGQSLGAIALKRAGRGAAAVKASVFLVGQQCTDGGVPISFDGATCSGDVDATAIAIQAFTATGRGPAASRAAAWLRANAAPAANTNSAGLVAAALSTVSGPANPPAVRANRTFIRSLQQGCSAPTGRRGAIAYAAGPFDKAAAPRATTQAILGLVGADLATLTAAGSAPGAPRTIC